MSLDFSSKELSLFCRGDLRVDGWKSDWRKDMERRQREEAIQEVVKK